MPRCRRVPRSVLPFHFWKELKQGPNRSCYLAKCPENKRMSYFKILREWKVIKMASYKCTAKLLDFFKGFNPLFFYFNCVDHVFYYWNFNHRLNWITIFVKMNTRKNLKKRMIYLKLPDLRLPFRRILRNPEKREDRLLWERTLRWTSCALRSRTWSDELWCLCPNIWRQKIAR